MMSPAVRHAKPRVSSQLARSASVPRLPSSTTTCGTRYQRTISTKPTSTTSVPSSSTTAIRTGQHNANKHTERPELEPTGDKARPEDFLEAIEARLDRATRARLLPGGDLLQRVQRHHGDQRSDHEQPHHRRDDRRRGNVGRVE